ncbi:hypothetical protein ACQE3E_10465 [Methylomonas sp. MED-D]|uniref:hypothetical protein n=1 Tax=unclassified Methylomonas TaxID=2608980 RepID=UPI0008DAA876|nr:hypothetical protein [Methylomonas sp. LWB]OHX34417.1 hypothetical protein BJL95_17260 [Methylomonas sp. LWB]
MYSGTFNIFKRYWASYGGFSLLIKSPYLHLALLLLILTNHFWINEKWWEQSISVLPNLLGFSLGGFAMFLGFGDEKFRAVLAEKDEDGNVTPYMSLCASFVHFIIVQFIALLSAIVAKSFDFHADLPPYFFWIICFGNGVGYLTFLYSITAMLAATMAVFRTCSWYEFHQENKSDK